VNSWLLTPPAVFALLLLVVGLLSWLASGLAAKGAPNQDKGAPYACGQDVPTGRIQPNYNDFFHFAFLFTILEVVTLLLGTVAANSFWLTMVILAIVILALIILFRKD